MSAKTYYSEKLDLVLEILSGMTSVEEIMELKSVPVRSGFVSSSTRILVLAGADMRFSGADFQRFSKRLIEELPEYTGTRTAVVGTYVAPTTTAIVLSKELAGNQSIGAFSTLSRGVGFLHITLEELLEIFSELKNEILPFDN